MKIGVRGSKLALAYAEKAKQAIGQGEIVTLDGTYNVPSTITTPTEFIDYNILLETEDQLLDHGHILDTVAMGQPACIYGEIDITGTAPSATVFKEIGDGRLFRLRGVARVPLDAKVGGTGLFKPQGASITNFSLLAIGGGHIPGLYGYGDVSTATELFCEGRFSTFSGAAESLTFNPEEKQMLFSFTGGYTDLKFTHGTWIGSGRLRNFATLEAEKSTFDWVGSGEIKLFSRKPKLIEPSDEKHTECYSPDSLVEFLDVDYGLLVDTTALPVTTITTQTITSDVTAPTGIIRVGLGEVVTLGATYTVPQQTTTPTEFIDYNIVNETEDGLWDHGHILDTVAMGYPFGEIYVKGTASTVFQPNWVGSGIVRVDNAAHTNFALGHVGSGDLFAFSGASETLAAAIEGTGLFRIGDTSGLAVGIGVIGSGFLRKLGGSSESFTINPEEKQMLFSFTGTALPPLLAYSEFSSGSIKSLSGGYITETEAYYGSGGIKLRSAKPKLTEPSEEKHTEVYDLGLCEDPAELDYGLLVDNSLITCVDVNGDINTNTVASSGCIKVDTTLSISATYTIPSTTTVATDSWDNGTLVDTEDGLWDYGWILDSTGKKCPFGPIGTLRGDAATREIQVYTFVATGESEHKVHGINIGGDAFIFVPPAWNSPGDPPIDVTGDADPSLTRIAIFDGGSLFGFGGAAECTTVIPPTANPANAPPIRPIRVNAAPNVKRARKPPIKAPKNPPMPHPPSAYWYAEPAKSPFQVAICVAWFCGWRCTPLKDAQDLYSNAYCLLDITIPKNEAQTMVPDPLFIYANPP